MTQLFIIENNKTSLVKNVIDMEDAWNQMGVYLMNHKIEYERLRAIVKDNGDIKVEFDSDYKHFLIRGL